MRAIILAAGRGSRMGPYTRDRPKCLIPFAGRTLLDHQLAALSSQGITDTIVVGGFRHEEIPREKVRVAVNEEWADTNMVHSLFCAEAFLDEDVVISYGDILYSEDVLARLLADDSPSALTADLDWYSLWEARSRTPLADAESFDFDEAGFIRDLGRPIRSRDEARAQYMGLIRVRREGWAAVTARYEELRRLDPTGVRKMYMTDFLRALIIGGFAIRAVLIRRGWLEFDTAEDCELYQGWIETKRLKERLNLPGCSGGELQW